MLLPLGRWRLGLVGVLASVTFLSFLAGATVTTLKLWPYPHLWRAFVATRAAEGRLLSSARFRWYLYGRALTDQTGIGRHEPARTFPGVTLFSSGHSQQIDLIDMNGALVHRWHRPLSELWPDGLGHHRHRPPDSVVTVRRAKLLPNGDVLALYVCLGETPWGCGLVKLDQHSQVLWRYPGTTHHSLALGDDGQIVTLENEVISTARPGLPDHLVAPFIEDYVTVLSADGEPQSRISISEAFRNSPYAETLQRLRPDLTGDLWHANAAKPLTRRLAERFQPWRPGQILLSLRNVDCLALLDPDARSILWATFGPWRQQHDPDFLDDGHLLLFDNLGPQRDGPRSRVLEIDPRTTGIIWQYAGAADDPLHSRRVGSQQRLPNGNTLITESQRGRILEVTRSGKVVWEYLSPFRAAHDPRRVGIVQGAERFAYDELDFEPSPPVTER